MQSHLTYSRRSRRRARVVVYLLATLVVIGGCGALAWWYLQGGKRDEKNQPLTTKVIQAKFEHSVVEQGEVESSINVEIKSHVKSRNTSGMQLLWVVPEGTVVQAGEDVVKLDASLLEQERDTQKIACNNSLAMKVQSENAYEAAKIAMTEYLEGTFQQEKQTIQSEIFVAEENLRRAENYLTHSKKLASKSFITSQQYKADQFAVNKAKSDLALATRKLYVLENYTRAKMLLTLETTIATTKAKAESDKESYALEQKKLDSIEEQVAQCTIKAPQPGQVVYANIPNQRGGSAEFIVEPGAMVREGQTILRMPDTKNMQVRAKINESRITDIRPGQPVLIKIDALGPEPLRGVVKRINRFAEPAGWFSSSVKQYATEITIMNSPEQIRTGLTAEVSIQIEQLPSALQVPVQSVVEHKGKTYVLAQQNDVWKPQEVEIGSTNDTFVRITNGVTPDLVVASNPRQHLDRFPFVKDGHLESSGGNQQAAEKVATNTDGPRAPSNDDDVPSPPRGKKKGRGGNGPGGDGPIGNGTPAASSGASGAGT